MYIKSNPFRQKKRDQSENPGFYALHFTSSGLEFCTREKSGAFCRPFAYSILGVSHKGVPRIQYCFFIKSSFEYCRLKIYYVLHCYALHQISKIKAHSNSKILFVHNHFLTPVFLPIELWWKAGNLSIWCQSCWWGFFPHFYLFSMYDSRGPLTNWAS